MTHPRSPWTDPHRRTPELGPDDCRASAWCGQPECGRYVLVADSEPELFARLRAWRCPRCEGPPL